jgi:hypothetical protein
MLMSAIESETKRMHLWNSLQQYQPRRWMIIPFSGWIGLQCMDLRHSRCACCGNSVYRPLWSLICQWRVCGCWRGSLSHTVERATVKFLNLDETQTNLEIVPVENGRAQQLSMQNRHTLKCATCSAACIWRTLVQDYPLVISVCALPYQLLVHFSVICSVP